jgi:hypothetical protein
MYYWCLLNLPATVRFNLCNIKLLALAKSEYLNNENISILLSNFIKGVNQLNLSGLDLMINNKLNKVNGSVLIGIGDTLALQELGGFVVGVGKAIKFCRTCEISHDERHIDPSNIYVERDINRHLLQLEIIKDSPELMKEYGVKFPSPLLELHNFDICKCLLHDPMHVLIEGVCLKELQNLLKYATEELGINLDDINARLTSFKYSPIDSHNKPNIIKKEHLTKGSFAQSAGQMQTLMLMLPFILGDLFNDSDKNWLNFINLHQILNLVFCFFYNDLTIRQLDEKIVQYLKNFKQLYADVNFTPKMHYLTHFPTQLENFGLLRNHTCFRFEAKNGLMGELNYHNFINIAYSCATKHQFWIASKELELKKKNTLTYTDDICEINSKSTVEASHRNTLKPNKYISYVKSLKLSGFEYHIGSYLIIELCLDKYSSSIGLIDKILNVDGDIVFYLQLFIIKEKIVKLNCIQIEKTDKYIYLKYDDLLYKQVNFSFLKDNKTLLPARYYYTLYT